MFGSQGFSYRKSLCTINTTTVGYHQDIETASRNIVVLENKVVAMRERVLRDLVDKYPNILVEDMTGEQFDSIWEVIAAEVRVPLG